MPPKAFIDSNIIVDFLCKRQPFDVHAAQLFNKGRSGIVELYITSGAFPFLFYLLSKQMSNKTHAWQTLLRFKLLVKVLPITDNTITHALASTNFKDLEDAIQYQVAQENGMQFFFIINLRDFKQTSIPVMTAEDFLMQI